MTGLKRTIAHLTQRVAAYLLVCILMVSGLSVFPPVVGINPYVAEPVDKIDDSLLNQTSMDQYLDVLVGYDEEASEFKAKNAVLYADQTAKMIDTFESIGMLHVKMLGSAIADLAKEEFITKIWSNEITPIEQVQTTTVASTSSGWLLYKFHS